VSGRSSNFAQFLRSIPSIYRSDRSINQSINPSIHLHHHHRDYHTNQIIDTQIWVFQIICFLQQSHPSLSPEPYARRNTKAAAPQTGLLLRTVIPSLSLAKQPDFETWRP
jgi:hypothetical protein